MTEDALYYALSTIAQLATALAGRMGFWLVFLLLVVYLVPTMLAFVRSHHQVLAIFALNILLGWTLLGWVMALVWALTAVHP